MQKLLGGILIVVSAACFWHQMWLPGFIALFIGLALIFNWKGGGDDDGGFDFDLGDVRDLGRRRTRNDNGYGGDGGGDGAGDGGGD